ncbi:MAG: GNAT family N-acetyltransferase [Hyphomicrobiales bacterium]
MATTGADPKVTTSDILHAESMVASAWPALKLCLSGRWLLGMAEGVSGRANSLFFLDPSDDKNVEGRLDWMEATYRRVGLPPRVRLSPLAPLHVVSSLQKRGYAFQNPTLTLKRDLPLAVDVDRFDVNIEISSSYTDVWIDTFINCTPRFQGQRALLTAMLDGILDETRYVVVLKDGKPVATAMGVIHVGVMTIQNVVTDEACRRQGFARSAMHALFNDPASQALDWCWLAVEVNNAAAISLYKSLGFQDFYRYIYASLDQ